MFLTQNWVAGCVLDMYFSSFTSLSSEARFSQSGITYSLLLALFIALQFFPCSCSLSVMFLQFPSLPVFKDKELSRGKGRGPRGRRVEPVLILAANFVMANKSGLTGN